MNYTVIGLDKLEADYKRQAMRIFVDSFYYLFSSVEKDRTILEEFFYHTFDDSRSYVCVDGGKVLGFIAIADRHRRSTDIKKEVCQRLFGNLKGFILYKQLGSLFNKVNVKEDNTCYIDFLAADRNFRGRGVGSILLNHTFTLENYRICTLDVLEKNTAAKNLYEKIGFVTVKRSKEPIKYVLGLGRTVYMRYEYA